MIISKAYDIEVLPNFFSFIFIDIRSYLQHFSDACITNKKGKKDPVPLVQKYTVKEIIERLDDIKTDVFYITDEDDSQLLQMVKYIQDMQPKMVNNIPVYTHCFGYNSMNYDKLMIAGFLSYYLHCKTSKELITKLYELSHKIISLQDNKELAKNDFTLKTLHQFKLPYTDIDVMRIFALNKVGKGTDAQGNTIFFAKSLKQTSINLQWYELLEHDFPPIGYADIDFYLKMPKYKGMSAEHLNKLIDKWDRYIIPEWIKPTLHYNRNDVFIVCEMIRLYMDEINLRYNISSAYEVNVLNSSRSNIADRLFEKFYSEFSGLEPYQWKGKHTDRTVMSFKRIILPFIKFKTETFQKLLEEMKHTSVTSLGKNSFMKEVKMNNLTYTVATGGLHSQDIPRELRSKIKYIADSSTGGEIWDNITDDSYIYVHWDIASFYPSLMVNFEVAPAHIDQKCFVKLIKWLRDTRVEAKHSKEDYIDGIPKDVLAQVLKIVINSIYGKLGYELGDICDRLAVLNVTINGQLLILMLCEELELNGIEVVSANTDGIVVKLYKRDKEKFDKIADNWKEITKFGADAEEYECYINRDINNYIVKELNGKISYKGALNPLMYSVDLQKGYDMPIVAKAVSNFFLEDKPVLESLYEARNILDFCKTQNVGRQFHVQYNQSNGRQIKMQRNVRFYASMNGGKIFKIHNDTNAASELCAGQKVTILNTLDDTPIELRNINYQYYLEECYKIIDPIKLNISPKQKGNPNRKTKSGKSLIKKYSQDYTNLFEDNEE